MEDFLVRFIEILPPHILAALIGSALGCWGNADKQLYGAKLSVIMGLLTVSGAGALAEFLKFDSASLLSVLSCFAMGGVFGFFGMSLLDALRIASPPFTAKLVTIVSDTLLTQIVSLIVDFFEMVRRKINLFAKGKLEIDEGEPKVGEDEEPYPSVTLGEGKPPYDQQDLDELGTNSYESVRPKDDQVD